MHRAHDRDAAELDALEGLVPQLRVLHRLERRALLVLGEVETGAEVLAVSQQRGRADSRGRIPEERAELLYRGGVERIPARRPRESNHRHRALDLDVDAARDVVNLSGRELARRKPASELGPRSLGYCRVASF